VGGYGSGRRGGTATAESTASYIIDIKSLAPAFESGKRLTGSIRFDEGRVPIVVTVDLTNEWNCFVELIHPTRNEQRRVPIVTDRVRLTSTQPTFGGRRWWFLCPRTGRRTTKLFLPNGGSHFWSRQAYGLGYRCQREDRFSRLQRRAAALNRQLGGEGLSIWADPPAKPKWMRWATYERTYERWEQVVERANAVFVRQAMRTLRRPAVSIVISRSRRL
jgi:hypothetical protein